MKKIYYILSLVTLILVCASCKKDKAPDSIFVEPVSFHFKIDVFGETQPYTNILEVKMVNLTEQISREFATDTWGKLLIDNLLPGEYTISVNGKLTPEESDLISEEHMPDGLVLGGFRSNIALKLNQKNDISIPISPRLPSTLIFKELYYAGSRTPQNGTYRNDIFFSIYNNTDKPIDLNNMYIGIAENLGSTDAPLWPGETQGQYKNVYVQSLWKIIDGDVSTMINPGKTKVIACMAGPHNQDPLLNKNSPVDLLTADYEAYNIDPENKYTDYPAPNMQLMFWPDYAYLWRMSVFGQGMMLIEANQEEYTDFRTVILPEEFWTAGESSEYWKCMKVPYGHVIEAVDLIKNSTTTNTKRFNQPLDSGFATMAGTYLGKSLIRKIDKVEGGITYYRDTNNSTEDFEINDKPLSK